MTAHGKLKMRLTHLIISRFLIQTFLARKRYFGLKKALGQKNLEDFGPENISTISFSQKFQKFSHDNFGFSVKIDPKM